MLSFCLEDLLCTIPLHIDIAPPVCDLMLLCTVYAASTHVTRLFKLSAPIILTSSIVPRKNPNIRLNFFQSSSSGDDTLLHKKATVGLITGLVRLDMYNVLATIE